MAHFLLLGGLIRHLRCGFFPARHLQRDIAVPAHGSALCAHVGGPSTHRVGVSARPHAARIAASHRAANWRTDPSIFTSAFPSGSLFSPAVCVACDEPDLCWLAYSESLRIRVVLGELAQLRTLLLLCDKPHLLVADRAALADTTSIEFLDDHSIPVDIGFCKHRFVSIPVFFRAVALSELWSCRTALCDRRTKGPDRSRGLHVGIRVFGVSCSRHLPDSPIPGERSSHEREDRTGEGACAGSVKYSSSSVRWACSACGFSLTPSGLRSSLPNLAV